MCIRDLHMLLHILDHIAQAFPFVVPCALVVDIAEHPLNGVGPWTVRRQPQQHKTGVTGQPLLDGFCFMDTVVIYHDIDTRYPWRWVGGVQQGQEVPKQSIVFARPKAIQHLTGGKMQCPCARVLLILPWCHDLYWRTLRHPRRPDFGAVSYTHLTLPTSDLV